MSPIIIPPAPGIAEELEQLSIDGLDLNSDTFTLEALNAPVPTALAEWTKGADSNGAILARPPLHENRVIEARIRVAQQANHDAVVAHIGSVLDKLQECAQNENGLPLVWDPANSTADPITFRCLLGEITDLPIDWQDSGRFVNAWAFSIKLTCLPFGEGTEVVLGSVTSSDIIQTLEVANVAGDVPALGRLVVFDPAGQSRRYVSWGLESRWYPTSSPPSLIVDSAAMVTTGYAGTASGRAGAYGALTGVVTSTLRTQNQAICGLGDLTHVGEFRPHLRFWASATTIALRLTYQVGDGPMRSLPYKVPVAVGYNCVDLGLISVSEVALGSQRWTGRIEAYSTATGGETFEADVMLMMPAEKYGRARSAYSYQAGVLGGLDEFTGITAGTALNGRVATTGGTWATSGVATDFAAADGPTAADETMSRATVSDPAALRYAILGATNYAAVETGIRFQVSATAGPLQGLAARWTDANNHLRLTCSLVSGLAALQMLTVIGGATGSATTLVVYGLREHVWYRLRIVAFASGQVFGVVMSDGGAVLGSVALKDTSLATGGTLATGKIGFMDYHGSATAVTRYYDDFYVSTPAAEPIVCYSGQYIEFRHDVPAVRKDAAGTHAGPPPEYIGPSSFLIPCAGDPSRKTRIAVLARRNDITTTPDDYMADSTNFAVTAIPRHLALPR